jgi:SAM-dependent methyltransferase
MRPETVTILRCSQCHSDSSLQIAIEAADDVEVRDGRLRCASCSAEFEVTEGVIDLLPDPPEFVLREAAGLERFAEEMRAEGWNAERIRALPDSDLGYWQAQRRAMGILQAAVHIEPGKRLLDIGANSCWASNIFAKRGLEVVALDISKIDLQGLGSAEHFLGGGVHFERLLSVMFDIALAGESFDYVFCSQVLHHNDRHHLVQTMREIYRVLRPGGLLLAINEPLRFPLNLKRGHGDPVAHFEGNEHIYFFHEYYLAARQAGFRVKIRSPHNADVFDLWGQRPHGRFQPGRSRIEEFTKRHRTARGAMLAYKTLIRGDVSLNLIGTKPA